MRVKVFTIFQSQALCVFGGSYVRGERIAGWMAYP